MARARENQLSASLEDYLEVIYNLAEKFGVARSRDIARSLGVSKSSVTGALRLLKEKGLANYEPYDYITLTEAGRTAAKEVVRRHNILKSFFEKVLGVHDDLAQKAACRAEHTLGPVIIGRLLSFIEFVTRNSESGYDLAAEFERFCEAEARGPEEQETRDD